MSSEAALVVGYSVFVYELFLVYFKSYFFQFSINFKLPPNLNSLKILKNRQKILTHLFNH